MSAEIDFFVYAQRPRSVHCIVFTFSNSHVFFVLKDCVERMLLLNGYIFTLDVSRAWVRVSGQDQRNLSQYVFDCGGCPDQNSSLPGTL